MSETESFDELRVITLSGVQPGSGARQLKRGDLIGGSYRLKSLIGRGGMGYVFCAEHAIIQQQYALKMLAPELLSESNRQRFEIEGRAIANLDHVNIVKVYNMGLDADNCPFYVMDLLYGQSLSDCIATHTLSISDSLDILVQIARGLGYAHGKGIVHRDVKPSNVILLADNNDQVLVKIVDFGIAKLLPSASLKNQSQTATGEVVGSPLYMSPEQCMGDHVDARTDIYSLGCTLFEMLTGRPPFYGHNAMETVMMHQNDPVPSIASIGFFSANPASLVAPAALDALISKMMAKRPDLRYQTMEQVVHDIGRLKLGKSIAKGSELSADLLEEERAAAAAAAEAASPKLSGGKKALLTLVLTVGFISAAAAACYLAQIVPHPQSLTATAGRDPELEKIPALRALLTPVATPSPADFRKLDDSGGDIFAAIPEIERSKKSSAAPTAETIAAALKNSGSFKATIVTINGAPYRRFTFPDLPLGEVFLPEAKVVRDRIQPARGVVTVSAKGPLEFGVGNQPGSDFMIQHPQFFDKLDTADFSRLALYAHRRNSIGTSFLEQQPQNVGFVHILKRAEAWTGLSRLTLKSIDFDDKIIAELNRLSFTSLETLSIDYRPAALSAQPFLMRLNELRIKHQNNPGPLIAIISKSDKLRHLAIENCSFRVEDLAPLAGNKAITDLIIYYGAQFQKDEHQQDFLELSPLKAEDIVRFTRQMPSLEEIRLSGIVVSPAAIRDLSHSGVKKIYLSKQLYDMAEQVRCKVQEPKVVFVGDNLI